MERKEAIEILKSVRVWTTRDEVEEALDLAISSLETDEAYQLEYEQPEFCADCISRESVKYYIQAHIHEIISESGTDKNAHTNAILRALLNGVATMPSVYPKSDAIPRGRIEQMVAELYKEADLMIDGEGEDCMAILIDDAIEIIHKYTKEQTNE